MKKLTVIILTVLLSSAISAQSLFSVPELTDLQKLQVARSLCYNNILMGINFAKSQGKSLEEYAKYCGDQFKMPSNQELGFKQFVDDHLFTFVAMSENVLILSQSENKIVFRTSQIYPALETQGPFWNVSFEEMMKWLEIVYIKISDYHGLSYGMKITDEGVEITIGKK
jgi:hypothetical protein